MWGRIFHTSPRKDFGLYYFNVLNCLIVANRLESVITSFGVPYKSRQNNRQECGTDPEPVYH